jgi:hypothetical protein
MQTNRKEWCSRTGKWNERLPTALKLLPSPAAHKRRNMHPAGTALYTRSTITGVNFHRRLSSRLRDMSEVWLRRWLVEKPRPVLWPSISSMICCSEVPDFCAEGGGVKGFTKLSGGVVSDFWRACWIFIAVGRCDAGGWPSLTRRSSCKLNWDIGY